MSAGTVRIVGSALRQRMKSKALLSLVSGVLARSFVCVCVLQLVAQFRQHKATVCTRVARLLLPIWLQAMCAGFLRGCSDFVLWLFCFSVD